MCNTLQEVSGESLEAFGLGIDSEYLIVLLVLCLGSVVQSGIGFGGALVALQLLLLLGLPLYVCILYTIILSTAVCILSILHLSTHCDWKALFPLIGVLIVSMPVGFYFQYRLVGLEHLIVRMCIGFLIILFLFAKWLMRVESRSHLPVRWGVLAASLSGVFCALANIGGPPLALWAHAQTWSPARIRVTMMVFILISTPFQLGFAFSAYGQAAVSPLLGGLLALPVLLAGGWIGLVLGSWLPRWLLRYLTNALLVFLSVLPGIMYLGS